jgi:cytidylate kinase
MNYQVAIDGPAGSGKSSISKILADRLQFSHIDTGAMYRAVTLEALNRGIDLEQDSYEFVKDITIEYRNNKILLNGKDVSEEIRSEEVSHNVSEVATKAIVREHMAILQRQAASNGNIIMDGRDIGYHVLPKANIKIFLNASVEERATRRYKELIRSGIETDLETIKKEIIRRDNLDSTRTLNPLKKAEDAIEIDTTSLSMEEVIEKIIELINLGGTTYGV